jgi:D-sedoheptulose 7-phosphate isomerase
MASKDAARTDVTALTCIANDYGYDQVLSRQAEGLRRPGDILVGFSTSGKSPNLPKPFRRARELGLQTILLGGKDGGPFSGVCDFEIIVPSFTMACIHEVHLLVLHTWLDAIDTAEVQAGGTSGQKLSLRGRERPRAGARDHRDHRRGGREGAGEQ